MVAQLYLKVIWANRRVQTNSIKSAGLYPEGKKAPQILLEVQMRASNIKLYLMEWIQAIVLK